MWVLIKYKLIDKNKISGYFKATSYVRIVAVFNYYRIFIVAKSDFVTH